MFACQRVVNDTGILSSPPHHTGIQVTCPIGTVKAIEPLLTAFPESSLHQFRPSLTAAGSFCGVLRAFPQPVFLDEGLGLSRIEIVA